MADLLDVSVRRTMLLLLVVAIVVVSAVLFFGTNFKGGIINFPDCPAEESCGPF